MLGTILIVDDDKAVRETLRRFFNAAGYEVHTSPDGKGVRDHLRAHHIDLVVLDLNLPDANGLDILDEIKSAFPVISVIILTGYGDVETAVKAIKMNADNFILKPVDFDMLKSIVDKCIESGRAREEARYLKNKVASILGADHMEKLRQPNDVYHAIRLLAENPSTNVLIFGETGTGKGTVASLIHKMSARREQPYMDINCAGLNNELLESELFGHERGAFTDAKTTKKGLLEIASSGTVFLDEIAELGLSIQAKLLKFIEERSFRRVGGTVNISVDVRIMAATNADLEKHVIDGSFRSDLFYRLKVVPIILPPLRVRTHDILPLAHVFLSDYQKVFRKELLGFSSEAEAMLMAYPWPGNIRELKNVIERAVLLCEDRHIQPQHLPENMRKKAAPLKSASGPITTLEEIEKKHIEDALLAFENNHSKTASALGIHRATLIKKIKKYNLEH